MSASLCSNEATRLTRITASSGPQSTEDDLNNLVESLRGTYFHTNNVLLAKPPHSPVWEEPCGIEAGSQGCHRPYSRSHRRNTSEHL